MNLGIKKCEFRRISPIKTADVNCFKPYEKKRGIVTLIKVMALLGSDEPKGLFKNDKMVIRVLW